jgi:pimeloyl-ACP methyl ester carboxylesterase
MENGRLFVDLAKSLASLGYAVLAYDRFGHGESDGDFIDYTVSRDVDHALLVAKSFYKKASLNPSAVPLHLVGFSLGAVVAAAAAGRGITEGLNIATLTMWSVASHFADRVREGFILDVPLSQLKKNGFVDVGGQKLGQAFVDDAFDFDPYVEAAPFTGSVLLLHGADDHIPAANSQAYALLFGARAELDIVEGADHSWGSLSFRDHLYNSTLNHITSVKGH